MGESVFEVVKQSVTAREAAELYGMSFSAFIRGCLIEKLSKKEAQR